MMPFGNGRLYPPLLLETLFSQMCSFGIKTLKKLSPPITVGSVTSFLDRAQRCHPKPKPLANQSRVQNLTNAKLNANAKLKANRKRNADTQSLSYTNLEPRKLLASISFDGGTLSLDGSGGNDTFRVNRSGTSLIARIDTPFEIVRETFLLSSVDSIEVAGRNGDDFFNNGTSVQSTFHGHAGNDRAFGGYAADTFFGGEGDDFFYGRQGIDTAYGWNGNDVLHGAQNDDLLYGQSGNDFIYGGPGNDLILGDQGNDRLFGLDGDDELSGGAGNDFVAGNAGLDALFGDAGNDVLRGGDDADELFGGVGSDLLLADDGNDTSYGGAGVDYIFDLAGKENKLYGDAGNDLLRGGSGSDEIHGGDGNDRLFGGDGDDSLYGDANVDYLNGGRGRDGLFGGIDTADRLIGGEDDDRFLVFVNQNLNNAQTSDIVVDAVSEDATLRFVSSLEIQLERVYAAGQWTSDEIELVDGALRNLHLETDSTRLLKLADGQDLDLLRSGNVSTSTGSPFLGLNFHDSNQIGFTNQLFADFPDRIRETVYHEFGHNFDTVDENSFVTQFRAISNWDQIENIGDRLSLDGDWYYNDDFNNFLRTHARTNPLEDFAVTYAEYFQRKYDGFTRAFVNPVEKFAVVESFLQS